jgi:hypothetical protein
MPIGSVAEILLKSENATRILLSRAKTTISRFLCEHCEHITENPRCRCLGMLIFSISNKLIEKIAKTKELELIRKKFRTFKDEVELLKSLPNMEVRRTIFADLTYDDIFFKKWNKSRGASSNIASNFRRFVCDFWLRSGLTRASCSILGKSYGEENWIEA